MAKIQLIPGPYAVLEPPRMAFVSRPRHRILLREEEEAVATGRTAFSKCKKSVVRDTLPCKIYSPTPRIARTNRAFRQAERVSGPRFRLPLLGLPKFGVRRLLRQALKVGRKGPRMKGTRSSLSK